VGQITIKSYQWIKLRGFTSSSLAAAAIHPRPVPRGIITHACRVIKHDPVTSGELRRSGQTVGLTLL
jgi:hypothetical protein